MEKVITIYIYEFRNSRIINIKHNEQLQKKVFFRICERNFCLYIEQSPIQLKHQHQWESRTPMGTTRDKYFHKLQNKCYVSV